MGVSVRHLFCGFLLLSPGYVSLWDSKLPTDLAVRGFPTVWKLLLLHESLPRMGLFCLSFCLLYFVLPLFKQNWLPFWVPGVLCQCSEVVSWNFFSIHMIFWWIFWGEKCSPSPIPSPCWDHPSTLFLTQDARMYNGTKTATSINGAGKLDSYMWKNEIRILPNTINKDKLKKD